MEQKYLPIGSICSLKGKNKKVMITGYYSVEFNGNLRIRDYQGCVYPEGMLLPEQVCTFNHTDIETVEFLGYKNDEQNKFQRLLDRLIGNESVEKTEEFHNENDTVLASSSSYSKLLFDENGVVVIAEPVVEESSKDLTPNIKFDDEGYVINVENKLDINNPFYKDYQTTNEVEDNSDSWNIFNKIEFDENGVVTAAEENTMENKITALNEIQFDENGVVISTGENLFNKTNTLEFNQYKFDENGVLISVNKEDTKEEMPENIEE